MGGSQVTTRGSAHVRRAIAPRARPIPAPPTPPHGTCGAERADEVVVHPHHPDAQLAGDARALVAVGRPHRRAEAERRRRWRARCACSSESTASTTSTGPGTSSRARRIAGVTPLSTVGRVVRRAASRARPPQCSVAPAATASSTSVAHALGAAAGDERADRRGRIGGSPTRSRRAASTTPGQEAVVRPRATHSARSTMPPHWPALANAAHSAPRDRARHVARRRARASRPCRRARATCA